MLSTPLRSIVMVATSRVNRTRPARRRTLEALAAVGSQWVGGAGGVDPPPPAVGRHVDPLGDVGAEEEHLVGAALPLDDVAAVARVPLEHVVPVPEEGRVVA